MQSQKDWVDFRAAKQSVSIQMVLEYYNLLNGLRKTTDELRGHCPLHKGKGERSFHVNLKKNLFHCFTCGAEGNVLHLTALLEGCSLNEAILKLKDVFSVVQSEVIMQASSAKAGQKNGLKLINPPLTWQLQVDHKHQYGLGRKLTKETLHFFGAGLCLSKGTFSGRFVIPLHNEVGELVGYAGRSLDDSEPKYLFPSRDKGFYKSHLLFNLHRVLNNKLHQRDPVRSRIITPIIVVEGFFSTMRLHALGFSSVSLLGSSLSEQQEKTLSSYFNHVVLLFDGDGPGQVCARECLLRLGHKMWITAIDIESGQQPDQIADQEAEGITILIILRRNLYQHFFF